jgi:hypothetical protein
VLKLKNKYGDCVDIVFADAQIMKKVEVLRGKYPRFVYENFDWEISGKDLKISFDFRIDSPEDCPPDICFKSKVIIKNVDKNQIRKVGDRVVDNLVFNLGLIELLSYWKATCSPEILIKAGSLSMKASPSSTSSTNLRFVSINKEQIKYPSVAKGGDERKFIDWWKDLIERGMGQFFYENKIDFTKNFLKINFTRLNLVKMKNYGKQLKKRVLVPVGGGKDSIVTLEILKGIKKNIVCFSLNPTETAQRILKIGGCENSIIVDRKIDPKLLALNRQGFLNGHTPFSAYLAFLSVILAIIFDFKYIAFSNERSSNEGNVRYVPCTETKSLVRGLGKPRTRTSSVRGIVINHQYSKSFDFERKFRDYSKKYLAKNVEYFSFLRPLYEIQIAKLFSKYPQYFNAFLSCNVAYQTASGTKLPTKRWCGKCPKCLFVFAILYPFIDEKKLIKIFGQNLFEKRRLLPLMLELIGERRFKPFECVGTKKESLIAFYLSWKKYRDRVSVKFPFLLKYFERKILPKYPNLEKEAKIMMNSWSNQHYLPKEFEKILN